MHNTRFLSSFVFFIYFDGLCTFNTRTSLHSLQMFAASTSSIFTLFETNRRITTIINGNTKTEGTREKEKKRERERNKNKKQMHTSTCICHSSDLWRTLALCSEKMEEIESRSQSQLIIFNNERRNEIFFPFSLLNDFWSSFALLLKRREKSADARARASARLRREVGDETEKNWFNRSWIED